MNPKHSPLPWHPFGHHGIADSDGRFILIARTNQSTAFTPTPTPLATANRDLVIQAVNALYRRTKRGK